MSFGRAASVLALLAACAANAPQPQLGEIWDAGTRQAITREAAMMRLAAADHVLLGEKHDNPEHHRLQAEIVGALAARGRRPVVVFEMLSADQAPALKAHLAAQPRDAAGLGAAVDWRWSDWSVYQPIAAAALDGGLGLAAGNPGRDATRRVMREGYDAMPELKPLLEQPLPAGAEAALLDDLEASHCGKVGRERLQPMLRVQRARDASMAAAMAAAPQSVLIAGAEHARSDRGVPWALHRLAPDRSVVALAFVELRPGTPPPSALPWDLVWFTTAVDRGDPCAGFAPRSG